MRFINLLWTVLIFYSVGISAQNSTFKTEITSTFLVSSDNEIPFWLRANSGFEFSEFTNFSGVIDGAYTYDFGKFQIEAGAYVFARDGVEKNIQRRDLYIESRHKLFKITLGSKQREEAFFGLSTTNQNYLLSNNARPLPGLIIEANEPFSISKKIQIDWGIAHYTLNDDRYVENTRVHYKRFNLIANVSQKSKVTLGIQHFAQWGGNSPRFGTLDTDLGAFFDVFLASSPIVSDLDNEAFNALGNHLGTYTFKYDLNSIQGIFSFYHEHPFEDGSGTRLQNFPDGVWGLTYKPANNSFIKGILYEYVDTRSQSGTRSTSGRDNYFSNSVYRSGWTYEQNVIGMPFFRIDRSVDPTSGERALLGSRFQVHHLGLQAAVKDVMINFRASYTKNIGYFSIPFGPTIEDFYFSANANYTYKLKHEFSLFSGIDIRNTTNDIFAAGASYSYLF